ncbi:MAG: nucleotidyltransferase domain-containing protein [Candidatus Thiodiazotropha sp.]
MSSYQPKDFIETAEGLVFAVVTADLDEERVLATLRYRRIPGGYQKLSTRDGEELLKNHYPQYIHYSKARDVTLHGVYSDLVCVHHQPRQRLEKILQHTPHDEIEEKLHRLMALFQLHGVNPKEMGVTGSLLIGAQKKSSDIDLLFYLYEEFTKAREIIKLLLHRRQLQPLDEALWRDAYERRGCSLTFDEYLWHEKRKYNKAAIGGIKFDITLLNKNSWQDLLRYRKQGIVNLKVGIVDDSHSFAYPARYRLDHPTIQEAVSYTATYVGQAKRGEHVEIRGQLEVSALGHLRVVIGANREATDEYIKVLSLPQD